MLFSYENEPLGDAPIWARQFLKNPHAGDQDAPDHHRRAIESIQRNTVKILGDRAAELDKGAIGKIRRAINYARHNSPDVTLAMLREHVRAVHSLPSAHFDTLLLMEQQIALQDGYETPEHMAHRQVIVEGEPFNDYREIKYQRLTLPPDFQQKKSPREELTPIQIQEKDGPILLGIFFRQLFGFDWEMSTVRDLMTMYQSMFTNGAAAKRTLEKYVFNDNLATGANGPSFQLDGSTVSLFGDHSTIRGVDNSVDTGGDPTTENLDLVVDAMSGATLDGHPIGKSYGYLIAREAGQAFRQAIKTLDPRPVADQNPDNANNTPNIYGRGRYFGFTPLPVDLDEWTGTEWYATFDFRRSRPLGFQMRWHRGLNTPQLIDLDGPNGSRNSRLTMGREFLIQMAGAGTWGDVVGMYRGNI